MRQNRATLSPELRQRQPVFRQVVTLYARVVAKGRVPEPVQEQLAPTFRELGELVGLEFDPLFQQALNDFTERRAPASTGGNVSLRAAAPIRMSVSKRAEANRAALDLLKAGRTSYTDAEKMGVLRLYTGQGGLAGESPADVGAGVLNQHYTSYQVARFVWDKLVRLGLKGGWVLEPGCGVGNFIGNKPSAEFNVLGFDYDPVASQIARILYPDDDIRTADHVAFDYEAHRGYLVGAVGNVPFGNYRRFERNDPFAHLRPLIHNHMILRTLGSVQPGGLVAIITSAGTMNARTTQAARVAMLEMAHFLGAYRLPNSAFRANASTDVTTDVLFFQVRKAKVEVSSETVTADENAFIQTVPYVENGQHVDGAYQSAYYLAHPENVLGETTLGNAAFARQVSVVGTVTQDVLDDLLARNDFRAVVRVPEPTARPAGTIGGKVASLLKEVLSAEGVLASLYEVIALSKDQATTPGARTEARKRLHSALSSHVKAHGLPQDSRALKDAYGSGPAYYQLRALARRDGKGKDAPIVFSSIVERDTLYSTAYAPSLASKKLADVVLYLRQTGVSSSVEAVAEAMGTNADGVHRALARDASAFLDPADHQVKLGFEYLSGYLPAKIAAAEDAGADFAGNVAALRATLPVPKTAEEIMWDPTDVNSTLPVEVLDAYIKFACGRGCTLIGRQHNWQIVGDPTYQLDRGNSFGWQDSWAKILAQYLNGDAYPAQALPKDADPSERAAAQVQKMLANEKVRRVAPKRFTEWMLNVCEPELRQQAVYAWNAALNATVDPRFDGSTFTITGMGTVWTNGKTFAPRQHQKEWVERALYTGSHVCAHGVGAGKTMEAIMLAGALRQRGLARKPLFAVPAKVIEKWIKEFQACFPGSRVLNLRMEKESRAYHLALCQMNDYDAVFITHEGLRALPMSAEVREAYFTWRIQRVRDDIAELVATLTAREVEEARDAAEASHSKSGKKVKPPKGKAKLLKDLLLLEMQMEQKIRLALGGEKDALAIDFDDLGIDALIVDEAHNFKNLWLSAKAQELGVGVAQSSDRAEELMMKTWWLNKQREDGTAGVDRNVFLLTATPTNNSPLEAFIFLSMVAPRYLRQIGLDDVDAFIQKFAQLQQITTVDLVGRPKEKTVVVGYKELSALRKLFGRYVEYLDVSAFADVIRPELEGRAVYRDQDKRDQIVLNDMVDRLEAIKHKSPRTLAGTKDSTDNYLAVAGSGGRGAVDPAFYTEKPRLDTGAIEDGSKADLMCREVAERYWKAPRTVTNRAGEKTDGAVNGQLIFCDPIATTGQHDFYVMLAKRLVKLGVPEREIAVISGSVNNTPEKKQAVADAYNAGTYRVVIGNTPSMGEGMDLNRITTDIHHLDVPWKPSELTQRNGRGHRQGNQNPTVTAHYYLTRRSMDLYRYGVVMRKQRWVDELWRGVNDALEAEGVEEIGLDFETVMMALQDDPDKVAALGVSRDLKRAVARASAAADDVRDADVNTASMHRLAEQIVHGKPMPLLQDVEAFAVEARSYDELLEQSKRSYNISMYDAKTGESVYGLAGGHLEAPRKTGYGSGHIVTKFGVTPRPQNDGKFHGGASFPTREPYLGADENEQRMKGKVFEAVQRWAASYPAQRASILNRVDDAARTTAFYQGVRIEARKELLVELASLGKLADQARKLASQPGMSQYVDVGVVADADLPGRERVEMEVKDLEGKIRTNPATVDAPLAFLGYVDGLKIVAPDGRTASLDITQKSGHYLFAESTLDRLVIVPQHRVKPCAPIGDADAVDAFETWHHFEADGRAFEISWPSGRAKRIGTAKTIWYSSTKMIEPSDDGIKANRYYHHFDKDKRPVHMLGDVILVENLAINGRGILN